MRLVTFNIRHGLGRGGAVDHEALAEAVRALSPDVLAIQEVDRFQPRSRFTDQARICAEAMGAVDHRHVPAVAGWMSVPGLRWRARGREGYPAYGIALASRFPVAAWRTWRLPMASRWVGPVQLGVDEPRAAVAADVRLPSGGITVCATHLSSRLGNASKQLPWLRDALREVPRPLVLMGDLNLRDAAAATLTGWRPLATAPTFPVGRPRFQLDHILVDDAAHAADAGGAVCVGVSGQAHALDTGVSDHRALVADVAFTVPGG
ncbi:endonuclease/exonuclease/phosphatase family protein [Myceligenerans indicum]|uniref:Endonuclease n=1 Tax=Myceligenerans indicum TaxID=2593663 RepID=A0ABS1LKZ3_9MICO|nr:endonuclease/exonuclease/phosphatase family protein [Myceligenerans indicum]MBL0886689.1 endonuclease [Myceligenerans indicum]